MRPKVGLGTASRSRALGIEIEIGDVG